MPTLALTSTDFAHETDATLYGGAKTRDTGSVVQLNFNRQSVESSQVLAMLLDEGTGTATDDLSATNANGTFSSSPAPTWALASADTPGANFNAASRSASVGQLLNYEYTQAWTQWAEITKNATSATGVIQANEQLNVGYFGYEWYIDTSGRLTVRLFSNSNLSAGLIETRGGTNLNDNTKHVVVFTYSGSGTAAGVQLYVDGVAETMTVVSDTLSGTIINGSDNPFYIGNQKTTPTDYYFRGTIHRYHFSNIARDSTWRSAYSTPGGAMPPADANTQLRYLFDECSGNGLTAYDTSGNARNATLNVRQIMSPTKGWLGAACLEGNKDNGRVTIAHTGALNVAQPYTLECWFNDRDHAAGNSSSCGMFGKGNGSAWNYILSSSTDTLRYYVGGAFRNSAVTTPIGWHHLAVIHASGTMKMYLDGAEILSSSQSDPATGTHILYLLGWDATNGDMDGYVSNVRFHNVALNPTDIAEHAHRFPATGVATITHDFTTSQNFTNLAATFYKASLTNVQFRVGAGALAGDAQTACQGASYADLASTQSISATGRYLHMEFKLVASTDTFRQNTPTLTGATVTYAAASGITGPLIGGRLVNNGPLTSGRLVA